jgi:hypothetical protein
MEIESPRMFSRLFYLYLCFYFSCAKQTNRHLDVVLFVLVRMGRGLTDFPWSALGGGRFAPAYGSTELDVVMRLRRENGHPTDDHFPPDILQNPHLRIEMWGARSGSGGWLLWKRSRFLRYAAE